MSGRLYKFLNGREATHVPGFRYRLRQWTPPVKGPLVACRNGYHLLAEAHLPLWIASDLFVAEAKGDRLDCDDKIVVGEAQAEVLARLRGKSASSAATGGAFALSKPNLRGPVGWTRPLLEGFSWRTRTPARWRISAWITWSPTGLTDSCAESARTSSEKASGTRPACMPSRTTRRCAWCSAFRALPASSRLVVLDRGSRHLPLDERDVVLAALTGREALARVSKLLLVGRPESPPVLTSPIPVDPEEVRVVGHLVLLTLAPVRRCSGYINTGDQEKPARGTGRPYTPMASVGSSPRPAGVLLMHRRPGLQPGPPSFCPERLDREGPIPFAADCAERVLPFYEARYPGDLRPWLAVQAARDFANGLIDQAAAQAAAYAAANAASAAANAASAAEREWQAARILHYANGGEA